MVMELLSKDFRWDSSKFRSPQSFYKSFENQKVTTYIPSSNYQIKLNKIGEELKVIEMKDWYRVTCSDINKAGGKETEIKILYIP